MHAELQEWIKLFLRWTHVFASILWVGTTYFFTWLDGRFNELEKASQPSTGEQSGKHVWMVHGGGCYLVEKQKTPSVMPGKLHWFRWEAAITWLTGLLLFIMVYYETKLLVQFEGSRISHAKAMVLSFALLIAGWLVYDLLWKFVLSTNEKLGAAISYLLIVAVTYGVFQWFAARAACLQLGAMFGTIMTANVWMRILPAQRRMVRALAEGRAPDLAEAMRAKQRSKHNTFIVIPVVFLMLSYHIPETYRWITVSILVMVGWAAASVLRPA